MKFVEQYPVTTPPNNQKKVTHSVAFPTNLPFKTLPQGQREFGLFEHVQFGSVQLLSHVRLFATPWIAACHTSLSITNSQSLLKLISIESVMPSNHLILCCPLSSCLQSFPVSGSFPTSQFFTSAGQSIGVSASTSVPPMNIQD